MALSLNSIDNSSDSGTNKENLIQNQTESTTTKKNYTFKEKFISTFLNIKPRKKKRKTSDNKIIEDEFINKNLDNNLDDSFDNESDNSDQEDPGLMLNKFRNMVRKVLRQKKNRDWKEFMEEYERKVKTEKSLKFRMKNIFNINSDFIIIWKSTFSSFIIIFIFIYFLKYILIELANKNTDDEEEQSNKNKFLYYMINIMFSFEFIFSVLILIFNGGSKLTFFKLPYKLYCVIPFPLTKKYILFLIPKFLRLDLIHKLFSVIESFINTHVSHYILNYNLKSFVTYIIELFKVLLIFGLYAHCLCCFLCYFEGIDVISYLSGLYYSIQSFTTIGFGEQSPATQGGLIIMIINLFLGVNFMSVTTSNIRYLYNKIQSFSRETSFNEQFEVLIFKIQRSTGKVFPNHLKTLMNLFLLYRRGMAYYEIKNKNKFLFDICRQKVVEEIHMKLFNYLKSDFALYFENCEDEFIFEIFQNMRPKMFATDRTLIKYNKRVKALYFLVNGYVFIYNKNKKPVYCLFGNNLIGEYEFITNQKCNYIVKTHPKMTAFGFELKKEDWDNISKKYIISTKNFFETIKKRKKKHNEWLEWSMNALNKNIFNSHQNFINSAKIEEPKEESLITSIDDNYDNENELTENSFSKYNSNELKINKTLITLAKEKNEKYDINNKEIFFNIFELRKKLKRTEDHFIEFKNSIIEKFKIKKN